MSIIKQYTYPSFLTGGGHMGALTREFDWSSTPLGIPDTWPQSLRTILSVIFNSRFPMFLWWGNDLIQFYNDAYRPSLGNNGKHPTALGQKGEDCWPEIWPIIKPLIDQVRDGGDATWSENQLIPIYRNGKIEDVYWTFGYSPVKDETDAVAGVLVVCNETTEHVINYQALTKSEDEFRFAIDATELGTWDLDPSTNKFTGNERLKEWFGLQPEEEIDLIRAINVIAEQDRPRVALAIQQAVDYSSGGFYDIEYSIIHPHTNKTRIVRAKGKALFNENNIAFRFNGTLQDITEQVSAHKKIKDAEEKTRIAVESTDLGFYETNLATGEIITSDRFNAIWGVDQQLSRPEWLSMIHPDDLPVREKAHEESLVTGKISYEARIIWKDSSVHWIKLSGRCFADESGKPMLVLGVVQDITQEKELEGHKDNFVSTVSHELKTPLTSLLGYAQLLSQTPAAISDPQLNMMTTKIELQAKRLNYIVQDLLDVTRIEGDKIRFREESFNFCELLNQIVEEVQGITQTHRIIIHHAEPIEVFADRERTSQVIANLLTNAIKYSPKNSEVTASSYIDNNEMTCSIKDAGDGISKENQAKIFERFYQVSEINKSNAGLGLGLYITSEIIKRQNGRIWLESEQGKGSTFYFTLPMVGGK